MRGEGCQQRGILVVQGDLLLRHRRKARDGVPVLAWKFRGPRGQQFVRRGVCRRDNARFFRAGEAKA